MAKTVRIHKTGGPEVLRIEDLPVGDPGPGEIRIRVQSIGLNRSEAIYRSGQVPDSGEAPLTDGLRGLRCRRGAGPGRAGPRAGRSGVRHPHLPPG